MINEIEGFSVPAKEVQFLLTGSDQFKIRKTLPVGNMLASLNSVGKMPEKLLKFEDKYLDFSFDLLAWTSLGRAMQIFSRPG